MFLDILIEKYKINLNKQQKLAVEHIYGPALILAGPGSGKTTVITARIAYLILEVGIRPDNILNLTFNNATQSEMENRFNRIFGSNISQKVRFSTIHSFCNQVVRDYEVRQGKRLKRIEGDEEVGENKRRIIRNIYQQINEAKVNDDELENLINEIGLVKNKMIKDFDSVTFNTKNFPEIYKAYEDYKKSNQYIDFDDMLTYAYSILKKCPDILCFYREKYRFIQVDEGQDLSKIQFEVLKLLVQPGKSNLFIVADDDQSIYGFRGAEPQYILNIHEQFKDCSVYRLENNYRSSKNIVDISSNFIRKNLQRFEKNHKTDNNSNCDPYILQVRDETEQLKYIKEQLKMHSKKGRSIAILYRNNLSSIAIVDALDRDGIEFKVKQNKLFFFSHWVVQDILAFLKFALNQYDGESFSRIYFKMNRYISKAMLEHALNTEYKGTIIDGILSSGDIKPYQKKTIEELKSEFKRLAKKHPSMALDYIEDSFKYFDSVKEYCENTGLSVDYLYSLFGVLKTVSEGCLTIPLFLQRIEELQALLEKPRKIDYKKAVTLTTMHSSKGLEYDVVLMIDLIESETPGTRVVELAKKGQDDNMLEEERRLFYVGMTRAREYLHLASPAQKNGIKTARSSFIDEVIGVMNKRVVAEIGEGMIINHKHFGEGIVSVILEQKGGGALLEIEFRGIKRKLDLLTCMENGLISF